MFAQEARVAMVTDRWIAHSARGLRVDDQMREQLSLSRDDI